MPTSINHVSRARQTDAKGCSVPEAAGVKNDGDATDAWHYATERARGKVEARVLPFLISNLVAGDRGLILRRDDEGLAP